MSRMPSRAARLREWAAQQAATGTEVFTVSDVCGQFGWSEEQAMHALSEARHLDGDGYLLSHHDPDTDSYMFTSSNGAAPGFSGPLNHEMITHRAWLERVALPGYRMVVSDPAASAYDRRYARKVIPAMERLLRAGIPG